MKIFKRFKDENLVTSQTIGKSIIYKLNFENNYVKQLISFLLADEVNDKYKRWQKEFSKLYKENRIVLLYGSIIKNYQTASDIDVMVVMEKDEYKNISKTIKEKQKILPKKIHPILLTESDLINNIKEDKDAIIDIIKNAICLYGQNKYVELIKNARNKTI
ncbi:nucleotidyltransferase domain-containing protein [Candidatus Woesearchaeota archaeon]|nr:nucleotidyltransferase domain-containing protein [Candidatus Woesearchaeota archaeon]